MSLMVTRSAKRKQTENGFAEPSGATKRARLVGPSTQSQGNGPSNHTSSGSISSALTAIDSASSTIASTSSSSPLAPLMIGPNEFDRQHTSKPFFRLSSIPTLFAPVSSSSVFPSNERLAPPEPPLSLHCSAFTPPSHIVTCSAPAVLISMKERSKQAVEIIKGFSELNQEVFKWHSDVVQVARTLVFNYLIDGITPPEMVLEIIRTLVDEITNDPASLRWVTPDYARNFMQEAYAKRNLPMPRDWEHWDTLFFPIWVKNHEHKQCIQRFFGPLPTLQSRCSVNFSHLFPQNPALKQFCAKLTSSGDSTSNIYGDLVED